MTTKRSVATVRIQSMGPIRADPTPDWEFAHIERARKDPAAFAPLYEAYVDLVWRYAMSRLGDQESASDATSQTFIKAIAALPDYRPQRQGNGTSFRSWLMTIARNVVIDEARKSRPAVGLDEADAQPWLVDDAGSPEDLAIAAAERLRIERALERLPETQRTIVELRAIGMKGVEIAHLLDLSIPAVKTASHRAYARLRELLSDGNTHREVSK